MARARFLKLAYKRTFESKHTRPMAAVITYGSKVLHYGINKTKSHPRQQISFNPHRQIHAELSCIIGLPEEVIEGSTVYIVRRCADGQLGLARPCAACNKLLTNLGVKQVIYSINGKNVNDINFAVEDLR